MKTENEDRDDDAFERALAQFRRVAPPGQWRDELIAIAVPGVDAVAAGQARRFTPRPAEKFFGGALAAAWLVIIGLWIATPDDFQSATTRSRILPPAPDSIQARQFPMLAWRFADGEPGEELFPETP